MTEQKADSRAVFTAAPGDFDPLLPALHSAPLIVYLDIKSPYAFIAKDPTFALEDELGVAFEYRPLTLNIPSYLGSARLDKKGKVAESKRSPEQWSGVKYAYRDARRYAAMSGYTLRGTEKIWDTSLIHLAFRWMSAQPREQFRAFLDEAYERFWQRDLDVEDMTVVRDLVERCVSGGVSGAVTGPVEEKMRSFDEYCVGVGRPQHEREQEAIFAAGIYGVPGYVIDGEYFFGREHLPLVRSLLIHKLGLNLPVPGTPPGIANPVLLNQEQETAFPSESLSIAWDFYHPDSLLALRDTLTFLDDLDQPVHWHPIQVRGLQEPSPLADDDIRGVIHRKARAAYRLSMLERYAALQDLQLPALFPARYSHWPSLGLLWLADAPLDAPTDARASMQRDYVAAVMDAIWLTRVDDEPRQIVCDVLDDLSDLSSDFDAEVIDAAEPDATASEAFLQFVQSRGEQELEAVQHRLQAAGAMESPAYFVGDEPFLGRQHLSWIRQKLLAQAKSAAQTAEDKADDQAAQSVWQIQFDIVRNTK